MCKGVKNNNLTYKTFMHTWKTINNTQNIWSSIIPQQIDYLEHELLKPDYYKIDCEDEFIENINMDNFFYKDVFEKYGSSHTMYSFGVNDEWEEKLVHNYICMLESQKRGFEMVKDVMKNGAKFNLIMFIRPDVKINNELPLCSIITNSDKVNIPCNNHYHGCNDQFTTLNYDNACIFTNRINETTELIIKQ